jgi:hypothetical protein
MPQLLHYAAVMGCLGAYVGGYTGILVWIADHSPPKAGGDDGR